MLAWIRKRQQWRRDHIEAFYTVAQKQSDELTLFQHQAILAAAPFIAEERFKRVTMVKEDGYYLVAPFLDCGAELYIYPNDAGFFGAKPSTRFEESDYRTLSDLLQALVQECAARAA